MSSGSAASPRPLIATVVACLGALGAALMPWLRTGEARRSAFALARSADALGFIDTPARRVVLVSWYLLPLLVAAAWTGAALRRPGVVAGLGALVGSMSVAAGSIVMAWTRPEPGSVAGVLVGAAAVVCSVRLAVSLRSSRERSEQGKREGREP